MRYNIHATLRRRWEDDEPLAAKRTIRWEDLPALHAQGEDENGEVVEQFIEPFSINFERRMMVIHDASNPDKQSREVFWLDDLEGWGVEYIKEEND